jgi:PKHD-type hydroxylase
MYPHVHWDGWFTEEELKKIDTYCRAQEVMAAELSNSGEEVVDNQFRKSSISMCHTNSENQWIFEKLFALIDIINDNYYNFDLYGFDFFQYTEYEGGGDKYDEHMDLITGDNATPNMTVPRKLSLSLILSDSTDYTGGEFEFNAGGGNAVVAQPRGRVIFFPSFILHAVKPVITGKRRSIVAWVLGPKFK